MYPYPLLRHRDLQGGICPKADAKHSVEHLSLQPILKRRQSKILNIETQITHYFRYHSSYPLLITIYETANLKQKAFSVLRNSPFFIKRKPKFKRAQLDYKLVYQPGLESHKITAYKLRL